MGILTESLIKHNELIQEETKEAIFESTIDTIANILISNPKYNNILLDNGTNVYNFALIMDSLTEYVDNLLENIEFNSESEVFEFQSELLSYLTGILEGLTFLNEIGIPNALKKINWKKVGLTAAGLAAAGLAGYGAYKRFHNQDENKSGDKELTYTKGFKNTSGYTDVKQFMKRAEELTKPKASMIDTNPLEPKHKPEHPASIKNQEIQKSSKSDQSQQSKSSNSTQNSNKKLMKHITNILKKDLENMDKPVRLPSLGGNIRII